MQPTNLSVQAVLGTQKLGEGIHLLGTSKTVPILEWEHNLRKRES